MKSIGILAVLLVGFGYVRAQFKPVDQGSVVGFKIKNLGFTVSGSFTGLQGKILFDPGRPADASFAVSVDAPSVNTDNSMRDDHLRAASYFDVENYPRISFQSTRIVPVNKGFIMFGRITMKNHSKEISFPFSATADGGGYLFSGRFTINRQDFGVGGGSILSEELEVNLSVLAK